MSEEPWQARSKCGNDKELLQWQKDNREDQFFDERIYGGSGEGRSAKSEFKIKRAREYCQGCPVRLECYAEAVQNNEPGIWAGTTERYRNNQKKKARRAALMFLKLQQVQLPDDSDPIAS